MDQGVELNAQPISNTKFSDLLPDFQELNCELPNYIISDIMEARER
jgi:hypothetical protein